MVKSILIKNLISFKEVNLNFKNGLILFSGPSGSGKSILIDAILALFGYKKIESEISEIEFIQDKKTKIIKSLKREKTVLFFNNPFGLELTYSKAKPLDRFQSKKFFNIAGILPHQYGKIKTNSFAFKIFS